MGPWTLLPILGVTVLLARCLRLGYPLALLYAVSLIIVLLFGGALLGLLWVTALSIHIVGGALLASQLRHIARDDGQLSRTLPLIVLAILTLAFWFRFCDAKFYFYDEYSHWGIYFKEMVASNAFWTAHTNAAHARYPPGTTLFQYFFCSLTGPTEGKAYLAQFVLLLTPLLLLLEGIRWRQWPWLVGVMALLLLVLTNWTPGIRVLYTDHVLGCWFAGTLLSRFLSRDNSVWQQALSSLPLATLALLKGTGLALALAAVVISAAAALTHLRLSGNTWRSASPKVLMLALVLLVPAVLSTYLWTWNRDRIDARTDVMSSRTVLSGLHQLQESIGSDIGTEIADRFSYVAANTELGNNYWFWRLNEFTYATRERFAGNRRLTTQTLLVTYVIWWLVLLVAIRDRQQRWMWGTVASGLLLTVAGYLASLYYMYLFAFGEQGRLLPSYTRYVNTVTIPMVIVSFAPLLPGFQRAPDKPFALAWKRPLQPSACLFLLGLVTLYFSERPHIELVLRPSPAMELRQQLESQFNVVRTITGESPAWICLPMEDRERFAEHVLKFLATPATVRVQRAARSCRDTPPVGPMVAGGFEYLWITAELQPAFATYRPTQPVDSPAGALFRVLVDSQGRAKLEPIVLQLGK